MKSVRKAAISVLSLLFWLCSCETNNSAPLSSLMVPTWISGSNTGNQSGTYGTQGMAATSNVPGSRSGAVSWLDSSGKLWLFGGWGHDAAGNLGYLNDLWTYDATSLQWTWVSGSTATDQAGIYGTQGTPAPSNIPGARHNAVAWLDPAGKLWLFGGVGCDVTAALGRLNDLWTYDPSTLQWTWVSGSETFGQGGAYGIQGTGSLSNVPGARTEAVSWIDANGKLWLFGGLGSDSAANTGDLNDLWMFDPATVEWTWISGANTINHAGTYGTQATPAPSNVPGTRERAVSWMDANGKLWLFGGFGNDSAGAAGLLNDLWTFDPTTLEWTWVSGKNTINQAGSYGTQRASASSNVPGTRAEAVSWIDSSGMLWLFGGYGLGSASSLGYLNDLWRFDPTTLAWTWESGNDVVNKSGTYGMRGKAASSNVPGGRVSAVSWIDSGGKLWLFGGYGLDSAGAYGTLNDLWQYAR